MLAVVLGMAGLGELCWDWLDGWAGLGDGVGGTLNFVRILQKQSALRWRR